MNNKFEISWLAYSVFFIAVLIMFGCTYLAFRDIEPTQIQREQIAQMRTRTAQNYLAERAEDGN